MVREGRIREKGPLPLIGEAEKYCTLPSCWEWVRLGELCSVITDGTHQTPRYVEQGRVFLSAMNVKPFRFMPRPCKFVSEDDFQMYTANNRPEKGDVLITRVGAMIGEAALVDQHLEFAIYVSLGLLKPLREFVHAPYLVHWLNSPDGVAHSRHFTLGKGHSQGNLNLNLLRRFPIPLPPMQEQIAISEHLDALRGRFSVLGSTRETIRGELASVLPSILNQAFTGGL